MARRRRKGLERRIAAERMDILFRLAHAEATAGNQGRADRYVALGRRIGMRYNVPLARAHRRRICPRCHAFLIPSRNATVRARRGRVVVHCHRCGAVTRIPYLREMKQRRRVPARGPP